MISSIVERIKSGETSARAEVEAALDRARAAESKNIFISLSHERALKKAEELDAKIKSGEPVGALAGVPFAAKDNFLTFGGDTTAAAPILEGFKVPLQATVIEKLEAEGAICIGKTNLDAFAHGSSTENSAYGPTKNAVDDSKVAGGSSGGSAVAVALGIVPFALGTDTGGSIRQPASFNGVVGVKPTYGMVSRYGVVAMASSTDSIGCLASNVSDAELVMSVMAGRDEKDMTTLPDYFEPSEAPKGQRIGVIKEFMTSDVDEAVRVKVGEYIKALELAGHTVEEVSLPLVKYALSMYYIVMPAEVSSNLARFDGVRYGKRAEGVGSLDELYDKSRAEGFVAENKRRIIIGSFVLSSGYFDAYYQKAQKARTLLINAFDDLFKEYDALLGPVTPAPAFGIGENVSDPIKMYLADIMTVPASMAGLPALSVPSGSTEDGLPVGVQLIGSRRSDSQLLALAKSMEVDSE